MSRQRQEELGRRIRQARERAGFSQAEVAEVLGISRPAVSQMEAGKRRVDSLMLRDLAQLLGVQPWELLEPLEDRQSQKEKVYQALVEQTQSLSAEDRAKIQGIWVMLDDFAWLRSELGVERPKLPESGRLGANVPKHRIAAEAIQIREATGLGDSPLGFDIRRWIEQQGIPVFMEHFEEDPFSGVFIDHPDVGPVLVVNASQVKWRQAFTLAHEFGHIWLHRHKHAIAGRIFDTENPDTRRVELQANTFAAEFLMPERAILRAIDRFDIPSPPAPEDVVRLQRTFGVSYKAMLIRLRVLRIITPDQFEGLLEHSPVSIATRLGFSIDPSEVGGTEELPFYEKLPTEYLDLVLKAWDEDLIGEGKAAELMGLRERLTLNEYVRKLRERQLKQENEEIPFTVGG